MRTTLDLHHPLALQAKAFAALQGMSLTKLIEEGLALRMQAPAPVPHPMGPMPVSKQTGGLAPGLTGLSTREIFEHLDKFEPNAR